MNGARYFGMSNAPVTMLGAFIALDLNYLHGGTTNANWTPTPMPQSYDPCNLPLDYQPWSVFHSTYQLDRRAPLSWLFALMAAQRAGYQGA